MKGREGRKEGERKVGKEGRDEEQKWREEKGKQGFYKLSNLAFYLIVSSFSYPLLQKTPKLLHLL